MPPKKDLTGQKFGDLQAINPLPSRGAYTYWMCRCICGEMEESRTDALILGKQCKHRQIVKIGSRVGALTCVDSLPGSKIRVKCDCGNVFDIFKQYFLDKTGFKCTVCQPKYPSMKGSRFGQLVVIEDEVDRSNKNNHPEVKTLCDCGNVCSKNYNALIRGTETSCDDCYVHASVRVKGEAANTNVFASLTGESLYWAGFIAADATIMVNGIAIQLSSIDQEHLLKLSEFVGEKRTIAYIKNRGMCSLNIVSKQIKEDLIKLGIDNNRAFTYSPIDELRWSIDFWRGMIDGDGWVGSTRLTIGFVGSIYACNAFAEFCSHHAGGVVNIGRKGNIYNVLVGGKRAYKLIDLLYGGNPSYYLDRKMELATKWLNHERYSSYKGQDCAG